MLHGFHHVKKIRAILQYKLSTLTACADNGRHMTRHRLGQLPTESLDPLQHLPVHIPGHGERQLRQRRGVQLGLRLLLLHAGRGLAQVLQQPLSQLTLVAGAGDKIGTAP